MIYRRLPKTTALQPFLEKEKRENLSYTAVAATKRETRLIGYDNDFEEAQIGTGKAAFEAARKAIKDWKMFPYSWTKILPEGQAIAVGENVAMMARFAGLWWRNSCRILYVIDENDRFGFAYGTLPGHIESGEELFLVRMDTEGRVFYAIRAFSKPRHILAKIGYPMVRLLQARFRSDSIAEMKKNVAISVKNEF